MKAPLNLQTDTAQFNQVSTRHFESEGFVIEEMRLRLAPEARAAALANSSIEGLRIQLKTKLLERLLGQQVVQEWPHFTLVSCSLSSSQGSLTLSYSYRVASRSNLAVFELFRGPSGASEIVLVLGRAIHYGAHPLYESRDWLARLIPERLKHGLGVSPNGHLWLRPRALLAPLFLGHGWKIPLLKKGHRFDFEWRVLKLKITEEAPSPTADFSILGEVDLLLADQHCAEALALCASYLQQELEPQLVQVLEWRIVMAAQVLFSRQVRSSSFGLEEVGALQSRPQSPQAQYKRFATEPLAFSYLSHLKSPQAVALLGAIQSHAEGDQKGAARQLERLSSMDLSASDQLGALLWRAQLLHGQDEDRLRLLRSAEALNHHPWVVKRALAEVHASLGQYDEQIACLESLLRTPHGPQSGFEWQLAVAEAAAAKGDPLRSREALMEAASLPGLEPYLLVKLAHHFRRQGAPQTALSVIAQAIESPAFGEAAAQVRAEVYAEQCLAEVRLQRAEQGLASLNKSLDQGLARPELLEEVCESLGDLSEFEEATRGLSLLGEHLEAKKEDPAIRQLWRQTLSRNAALYEARGQVELAAVFFRKLVFDGADSPQAFQWLESFWRGRGNLTELIFLYRHQLQHIDSRAERVKHLTKMARLKLELKLNAEALTHVQDALELAPSRGELLKLKVEILEHLESHLELRDGLLQLAEHTLTAADRSQLLHRAALISQEIIKDAASAAQAFLQALTLTPNDRGILLSCRGALRESGHHKELVPILERLALQTYEPSAKRGFLIEAGDILFENLQQPQAAYRFYQQALEIAPSSPLKARLEGILHKAAPLPPHPSFESSAPLPSSSPPDASSTPWSAMSSVVSALSEPVSEEIELDLLGPHSPKAPQGPDNPTEDEVERLPFSMPSVASAPDWRSAAQAWTQVSRPKPEESALAEDAAPLHVKTFMSNAEPSPSEAPIGLDSEISIEVELEFEEHTDVLTSSALSSVAEPSSPIGDARYSDNPYDLIRVLEVDLEGSQAPLERARIHQELGCLYYYELSETAQARVHLEAISEFSDEVARESETLNALEGVLQDIGDHRALLQLYLRRLELAEHPEMRHVYRLLGAQTCLEALEDPKGAAEILSPALAISPPLPQALYLATRIHIALQNPKEASTHLNLLLKEGDLPETERIQLLLELAHLYLQANSHEALKRVVQELQHYSASPRVRTQALQLLKQSCRSHDDWPLLVRTLVAEITHIYGAPKIPQQIQDLLAFELEALPRSQLANCAHSLREIADLLSLKLNQQQAAMRVYSRHIEITPNKDYSLERLIELARQQSDWKMLSRGLIELSRYSPDPPTCAKALLEAAKLSREKLGELDRAHELLIQALSVPQGLEAHERKVVEQQLNQLQEWVGQSISVRPMPSLTPAKTSKESRVKELLHESHIQDNPLPSLKKALTLAPESHSIRLRLIQELTRLGEVEKALNQSAGLILDTPPPGIVASLRQLLEKLSVAEDPHIQRRAQLLIDRLG